MDTKSALSTAGALVLVVAGGASALAAARSAPAPGSPEDGTTVTTIVTEYVDPDGNPVAAPGTEPPVEIRSLETDGEIIVVETVEPEIIWIDAPTTSTSAAHAGEYEDDDSYDDEYEDDEHDDE